MQKKRIKMIVWLTMLFSFVFLGQENDLLKIEKDDIKQIVKHFSEGTLNKDTLIKIMGENIKIYHYNPNWTGKSKFVDTGLLFVVEKGSVLVILAYQDKRKRDSGYPAISVSFEDMNGIPISILVEIFGKWTDYTNEPELMTKYPFFGFEKQIDKTMKIDVQASGIFGPLDKPMKCVCLRFYMEIEEIK
jgi:hypothetical protein